MAKRIVVNTYSQKLRAYESDGTLRFEFTCLTGRRGFRTDCGDFRVEQKQRKHWSAEYRTWLHWWIAFNTLEGEGFHVGNLRDAGSHGCVRLSDANASALYRWTPEPPTYTRVQIVDRPIAGEPRRGRCDP